MLSHWFTVAISPHDFFYAVEMGHIDPVRQYLYENRFKMDMINAVNFKGETALYVSVRKNNMAILRELLAAPGINVNDANENGSTPLMAAMRLNCSREEREAIVNELLGAPGLKVNLQNRQGHTALIHAASRGYTAIVEVLLEKCSADDVNMTDGEGKTALYWAAENNDQYTVELLLAVDGIDATIKANNDYDALMIAEENECTEVVELLLRVPGIRPVPFHIPSFQERLEAIEFQGKIPLPFCDPISQDIMNTPIVVSSGQAYDIESLKALFDHTEEHTVICPLTRLIIRRDELENAPCVLVKGAIEDFVAEQERLAAKARALPAPDPVPVATAMVPPPPPQAFAVFEQVPATEILSAGERARQARLKFFAAQKKEEGAPPHSSPQPR